MTTIIKHVAIIMDGNGRWAKKRHLPRSGGHVAGVKATKAAVQFAVQRNLASLTLYAFSSENWQRPKEETNHLMALFVKSLQKEIKDLNKHQVKVHFIGERTGLSQRLQTEIEYAEDLTKANQGLKLNIALNYGGRSEIVNAVIALNNSTVDINTLTEEQLAKFMCMPDQDDVDLLIRTGGDYRISNFLLWHIAYSQLYFTDVLWPDFNATTFDSALTDFKQAQRRFGKTGEQLAQC